MKMSDFAKTKQSAGGASSEVPIEIDDEDEDEDEDDDDEDDKNEMEVDHAGKPSEASVSAAIDLITETGDKPDTPMSD